MGEFLDLMLLVLQFLIMNKEMLVEMVNVLKIRNLIPFYGASSKVWVVSTIGIWTIIVSTSMFKCSSSLGWLIMTLMGVSFFMIGIGGLFMLWSVSMILSLTSLDGDDLLWL